MRARAAKSTPGASPRDGSPPEGNGGKLLDALAPAFAKLKSRDWTERLDGLRKARAGDQARQTRRRSPNGRRLRCSTRFTPTLGDSNSKVSSQALEDADRDLTLDPRRRRARAQDRSSRSSPAGIGSTNEKVRGAAEEACESLVDSVSPRAPGAALCALRDVRPSRGRSRRCCTGSWTWWRRCTRRSRS